MSRFLGPIHHWLYNKIALHEELEKNILNSLEQKYGMEITQTHDYFLNKYGDFLEDKPLEELIDTNNIHGWLQNRINIAEGRFADFVTTVLTKFQGETFSIIEKEFERQGTECGKDAKDKYEVSSAPDIYKALNNYILDGMPCDNVNNVVKTEANELEWKVTNCLHKKYWTSVNGDLDIYYNLRSIWTEKFVENANNDYNYEFKFESNVLKHKIISK
ncbi:hypothetical protein GOQ27_12390 [Clostridium sp. D2Q-11]|uniref:Uncharacterized protein n=1 Tax=Anaeromonas frigoriresistens TaxID=2683708 RepID=A0A942UZR2_9FIRM|nr:hypothetical protein [Anaeromonas frigoriresistens]MBS4539266.1 hypothetical protein [Anaeromonas frigoriresistens]